MGRRPSNFPALGEPHCTLPYCASNVGVPARFAPSGDPSLFLWSAYCVSNYMITTHEKAFSAGKYLVSPMTRINDSGQYIALVSIRNGSHDRVFRFTPQFASSQDAVRYAIGEARTWLRQRMT
jgi:hypothetical protein